MSVSPPLVNEELAYETTRKLAGILEAAALLLQAVVVFLAAQIERVTPVGQQILWGIAIAHGVVAIWAYRTSGPFTRGGPWTAMWLGLAILMPLVMAHLVGPDEYGIYSGGIQLGLYTIPVVAMFAFYPWLPLRRTHLRFAFESAFLSLIIFEPFLIVKMIHFPDELRNYLGPANSAVYHFVAYIWGKAIGRMCLEAAALQIRLQTENFKQFYRVLHNDFKSEVNLMRRSLHEPAALKDSIERLAGLIAEGQNKMLTLPEQVSLAELFSERIRVFREHLEITPPLIGALTARRSVALLLDEALAELLSNATQHGAHCVILHLSVVDKVIELHVADDGPGFGASVLDDESRNLHRLRERARELGGDLVHSSRPEGGTLLTVSARLQERRTRPPWRVLCKSF